MFLGHPLAGAMIAAGLLIADRRAFCWALLASVAGMGWSLLHHDFYTALLGLGGYNAVLAALAFSSQRRQPWLPLVGIGLALLLTPVFAAIGLPTLTAPFILAGWLIRCGCCKCSARPRSTVRLALPGRINLGCADHRFRRYPWTAAKTGVKTFTS